jgi:LysR family transcriptional activator of nhaA
MSKLINYQHLYYFWCVAKEGNLTRVAQKLHVAQSAISIQIKKLEERLENGLFYREGRKLILTEAGKIVLEYADEIFKLGDELTNTLSCSISDEIKSIKIGAVSTLSRNFQEAFLAPILKREDVKILIKSGQLDELIVRLELHDLDIILSNTPIKLTSSPQLKCKRIAQQKISVIGKKIKYNPFKFPHILNHYPLVLPTPNSEIRMLFDTYCDTNNISPTIFAEADDMATLRLIARDTNCLAIIPKVVVKDELRNKLLHEYGSIPRLYESFYAIYLDKKFQSQAIKDLISARVDID